MKLLQFSPDTWEIVGISLFSGGKQQRLLIVGHMWGYNTPVLIECCVARLEREVHTMRRME